MNDRPVPAVEPPHRIHHTVALDYRVRTLVYPPYIGLYFVHMWARGVSPWAWALLLWQALAWPHVAHALARHSRDSKNAERRNLLVDSLVIGAAVPLTGYSLWPNAAALLGMLAGMIAIGGLRFSLKSVAACVAGAICTGLIVGFHPDLFGASALVQLLSLGAILGYLALFARQTFVQSQAVMRNNRQIRLQGALIEEKGALLEQRSRELEKALAEAESANTAKDNFLANMSHELRTPLNSIIGFANILLRNRAGTLSAKDVTYLTRITANGSQLLTLINGVLDLSKIDAHQMQLELTQVDVAELIRDVLGALEPQAEARHVELIAVLPDVAPITTDRARLKQIMLNLAGNAVKFTANGRVTLRVERDDASGRPVRIDVIDTGVGIAPDRMSAVFEAFQQEDLTTSRQFGGTGLGLTITRSLVHLMGWEITASSEVGIGSTFSVVMPPPRHAESESSPSGLTGEVAAASRLAGHDIRVLVIDDDLDARTVLSLQHDERACEVMTPASATR